MYYNVYQHTRSGQQFLSGVQCGTRYEAALMAEKAMSGPGTGLVRRVGLLRLKERRYV
jgi:hypothetical protein